MTRPHFHPALAMASFPFLSYYSQSFRLSNLLKSNRKHINRIEFALTFLFYCLSFSIHCSSPIEHFKCWSVQHWLPRPNKMLRRRCGWLVIGDPSRGWLQCACKWYVSDCEVFAMRAYDVDTDCKCKSIRLLSRKTNRGKWKSLDWNGRRD